MNGLTIILAFNFAMALDAFGQFIQYGRPLHGYLALAQILLVGIMIGVEIRKLEERPR